MSGGSPAASPASCRISIARWAQPAARADGRKMIALRVLAATIDLNSAVEVGLVMGSSAEHDADRLGHLLDAALGVLAR